MSHTPDRDDADVVALPRLGLETLAYPLSGIMLLVIPFMAAVVLLPEDLRRDMARNDHTLTEALFSEVNQGLTIMSAVVGPLFVCCLVRLVQRLPQAFAAREARVDERGLELVMLPRWWFRGRRSVMPWADVRLITTPEGPSPEDVTLTVLNGAGISGLAGRTAEALEARGFTVADIGNTDPVDATVVRYPPGERAEAELAAREIGRHVGPDVDIQEDAAAERVTVVLGADAADG
jgi:hypothetical protein